MNLPHSEETTAALVEVVRASLSPASGAYNSGDVITPSLRRYLVPMRMASCSRPTPFHQKRSRSRTHGERAERSHICPVWTALLTRSSTRTTLSSRETGESAAKSSGFGPDPRGSTHCPTTSHSKRRRGRKRQEPAQCVGWGRSAEGPCGQGFWGVQFKGEGCGSPAWIRTTITLRNAESATYGLFNGLKCRNRPEKPALVHNSYTAGRPPSASNVGKLRALLPAAPRA